MLINGRVSLLKLTRKHFRNDLLITYYSSYNIINKKFCMKIFIPFDKLTYNYCRSSGPGGQNVNKVNTKVEVRVHIDSAYWLNDVIKQRVKELHSNKINSDGELILTCSETRSQTENKIILEKKLAELFMEASKPKAVRNFDVPEETEIKKEFRIKEKKKRSDVKQTRNMNYD
jgi:peptidyl-tRNA hydrolase ICT1